MAAKKTKQQPRKVIVRTCSAGVHFGALVSRDGKEVVLANAKRIWKWVGAWTLHEVAAKGASSLVAKEVRAQNLSVFTAGLQPEQRGRIKWDALTTQQAEVADIAGARALGRSVADALREQGAAAYLAEA